jgi:hypothetical protein
MHQEPVVESPFELGDRHDSAPAGDFTGDSTASGAYNEAAFRYFLTLEQKRAHRANRQFLLLLMDLNVRQTSVGIEPDVVRRLFTNLSRHLRETDFVGWYHEGRVVGAVLTQHAGEPGSDAWHVVAGRVTSALAESLSADLAENVQVRVHQLPSDLKPRR